MKRLCRPCPGKMPTMISGRPYFALGFSAAKMRCVASGSSRPMPSRGAGQGGSNRLTAFLGLCGPCLPARSCAATCGMHLHGEVEQRPCAGSSPACSLRITASRFRSIPPANEPSLPEVIDRALDRVIGLARRRCRRSSSSKTGERLITFMDLDFTSQVMVATPLSPSLVSVKFSHFSCSP